VKQNEPLGTTLGAAHLAPPIENFCPLTHGGSKMHKGEKNFSSTEDRLDRVLVISNSILTVVSIIITVIDIVKMMLMR
jgi:hypothetical protein